MRSCPLEMESGIDILPMIADKDSCDSKLVAFSQAELGNKSQENVLITIAC